MLHIWLFFVIVDSAYLVTNSTSAASSIANSTITTSKATTTTSSISLITPISYQKLPCQSRILPTIIDKWRPAQVCDRPEQPFIDPHNTAYLNPYDKGILENYQSPIATRYSYCSQLWEKALDTWLETAPITYGSVVPIQVSSYGTPGTLTSGILTDRVEIDTAVTTNHVLLTLDSGDTVTYDEVSETRIFSEQTTTWTDYDNGYYDITYAAYTPAVFVSDYSWTASSPCCSSCSLFGGDVQVYYWPTPAPSPPISTLVNSEGFTFVSPSVYVAFRSLYASNLCGRLGETYNLTTIGFKEQDLSTGPASFHYNTTQYPYIQLTTTNPPYFREASWGDYNTVCTDIVETIWKESFDDTTTLSDHVYTTIVPYQNSGSISLHTYVWTGVSLAITYNPCSPMLSIPTQLYSLNPLWKTCSPGISAFFDPPYVLTSGHGLTPLTLTQSHAAGISTATTTNAAVARPTVVPTTPTPTGIDPAQTPNNNKPTQTATNNDPPGDPPGDPSEDPPTDPAQGNPEYRIGSQVLIPGAPAITVSGMLVSLDPGGSNVVVGTKTEALSSFIGPSPTIVPEYQIGTQILQPGGPATTVSGTRFSLDPDGSTIIVGTKTEPISDFSGSTMTVSGNGGVVISLTGLGQPNMPTAISGGQGGTNGTEFTGGASKQGLNFQVSMMVSMMVVLMGLWV